MLRRGSKRKPRKLNIPYDIHSLRSNQSRHSRDINPSHHFRNPLSDTLSFQRVFHHANHGGAPMAGFSPRQDCHFGVYRVKQVVTDQYQEQCSVATQSPGPQVQPRTFLGLSFDLGVGNSIYSDLYLLPM